jgi:hypothetical protein
MSGKITLQAAPTQRMADVDANGFVTEQHVAAGPYLKFADGTNGELLLCGAAINYSTFKGAAPGAHECAECKRLDA